MQNNLLSNRKTNTKSAKGEDFMLVVEFLAQQEEIKVHLKNANLEEFALLCEKTYNDIKNKNSKELEIYVMEILQQETKSHNDKDYKIQVYNSIYKASSEFWGNIRPQTKDENSRTVILCDGIGGLAGLLFGGVGSIIIGTAMSYFADEALEKIEDDLIGPPIPF